MEEKMLLDKIIITGIELRCRNTHPDALSKKKPTDTEEPGSIFDKPNDAGDDNEEEDYDEDSGEHDAEIKE